MSTPPPRSPMRRALLPVLIVLGVLLVLQTAFAPRAERITFQQFEQRLDSGRVEKVTVDPNDRTLKVRTIDDRTFEVGYPGDGYTPDLLDRIRDAEGSPAYDVKRQSGSFWGGLLLWVFPLAILIGFWVLMTRQMQGGTKMLSGLTQNKARLMGDDGPRVGFGDVAGCDEAIEELTDFQQFLSDPSRFLAMGARVPKGVLLYGPPGTGKTLLARATAHEAGVPFFSISGSDFVEMFVGVGAGRVRTLFAEAKQHAPCIVFIDEIDAVGRQRGAGMGGGHDEREQTLNQLLVEMDGFEGGSSIIVMAATNRLDILDPALLRPGRFDRHIQVDPPDRRGRARILGVHARGKPIGPDVSLDTIAAQTPGMTGADLANLVNEAAILAVRSDKKVVGMAEFEEGIMRVIAGPERRARVMSEHERDVIAYHEMGHALVGHHLPDCNPVHKISVIARGQALGLTISLPTEDRFLASRSEMLHQMAMTLGGRAAEALVFGEVTSGASDDLKRVTATAKQMIMRYGMSERLGQRVFGHEHSQPFLGREFTSEPDYSDEIAEQIDAEIKKLVDEAYAMAEGVLTEHRAHLTLLAEVLLRRETILAEEFQALIDGASEEEVWADDPLPQPLADATPDPPASPVTPPTGPADVPDA